MNAPPPLPPPPDAEDNAERPRPTSLPDLFWSFSWLALQGFGGVLAVVQRELVERKRWLAPHEFIDDWAVAQILPGPNVGNLAIMIGSRHFGAAGAAAALAGLLVFPMLLLLLMAALYAGIAELPAARGALRGMGAIAAALIAATGFKLIRALKSNPMGRAACISFAALTFVAIAWLKIALPWVLLVVGGTACAWAWRCLKAHEGAR